MYCTRNGGRRARCRGCWARPLVLFNPARLAPQTRYGPGPAPAMFRAGAGPPSAFGRSVLLHCVGQLLSTRRTLTYYINHPAQRRMTSGQSLATEAFFGPPSEAIKVADFLHEVVQLEEASSRAVFAPSAESLPERARRASIEVECRYVFSCDILPCIYMRTEKKDVALLNLSHDDRRKNFPLLSLQLTMADERRTRTACRMCSRPSTT